MVCRKEGILRKSEPLKETLVGLVVAAANTARIARGSGGAGFGSADAPHVTLFHPTPSNAAIVVGRMPGTSAAAIQHLCVCTVLTSGTISTKLVVDLLRFSHLANLSLFHFRKDTLCVAAYILNIITGVLASAHQPNTAVVVIQTGEAVGHVSTRQALLNGIGGV